MREALILRALRDPVGMLALDPAGWETLIRQARKANLLARLWCRFEQAGLLPQIPAPPCAHLRWANVVAEGHANRVRSEVAAISKALPDEPLILLKGAAYTMACLPASMGRIFSDIDIMVPNPRLIDVENALMASGWVATHHDAYDQRYYRQWMHELPPLQHIRRDSVIDVHHAILPQTMAVHPDPGKLRAAAVALEAQQNLAVLQPLDMVLHSAAHLFYEGETGQGLRDLSDLDLLLRHFSGRADFWPALVARAEELELTRVLFYALRYTRLMLHAPMPANAVRAADVGQPGALLLRCMDMIYRRALLPDVASCSDALSDAARFCVYIRANWLRMPPLMLARHLFHKAFISPKP